MLIVDLPQPLEFEWDEANKTKIWNKHRVAPEECEEAFTFDLSFMQPDELHSEKEGRYILVSQTRKQRSLFVVFTLRKNRVRVISARNMHKKEREFYEKEARTAKI